MSKTRIGDKAYGTYSTYKALDTGICVTCPRCGSLGIVTASNSQGRFRCSRCGHVETRQRRGYRHRVQNLCRSCGRYYSVPIRDRRQQSFPVLRVPCPYCGHVMPGRVERTQQTDTYVYGIDVRQGRDPIFGFDLWFRTDFDGRPVWALDREHLAYLIDYLSAGLREKPFDAPGLRTQADMLPTFMKTAKDRRRLVRKLQKLQQK